MSNKDEGSKPNSLRVFLLAIVLGGIFALLVCFVLLFLLSIAIMFEFVAEKYLPHICIIICAISSFIGGRSAVKRGGKSPLLTGVISGIFLCIIVLLIAFFVYKNAELTGNGLGSLLALFFGGLIAGGIGLGKTKKRRVEKEDRKGQKSKEVIMRNINHKRRNLSIVKHYKPFVINIPLIRSSDHKNTAFSVIIFGFLLGES